MKKKKYEDSYGLEHAIFHYDIGSGVRYAHNATALAKCCEKNNKGPACDPCVVEHADAKYHLWFWQKTRKVNREDGVDKEQSNIKMVNALNARTDYANEALTACCVKQSNEYLSNKSQRCKESGTNYFKCKKKDGTAMTHKDCLELP